MWWSEEEDCGGLRRCHSEPGWRGGGAVEMLGECEDQGHRYGSDCVFFFSNSNGLSYTLQPTSKLYLFDQSSFTVFMVSISSGLQPTSDGLQPTSEGL